MSTTQHEAARSPSDTRSVAAEALDAYLRASGYAVVAALGEQGILATFPESVPLHGQTRHVDGLGIDLVVPEDQGMIIDGWARAANEPIVRLEVRLLGDPSQITTIHLFDVRADFGVHVAVLEAGDPELVQRSADTWAATRPAVGRIERDGLAVFLAVDDVTTALLGWTAEDLLGRRTIDFVHPDDAGRGIDAWLAMRAGTGNRRTRVRYQHADGHYVWVEVTNDNRLDDPEHGRVFSELVDVSAEMAHLEAIRDRERHLARLAEAIPIGICHVRADGDVAYSNPPLVSLLGSVDHRDTLVRRIVASDRWLVEAALSAALRGQPGALEVGVGHGGEERRCEVTLRPMTTSSGEVDGAILCATDVTDRSRLRTELEHQATHDDLSGCLNRAASVVALERAMLRSPQVAVAYIDLDGFKRVNDDQGHAAGDALLRVAAERMRTIARGNDELGRIGGDEFILICPSTGPVDEPALITRLTDALNTDIVFGGHRIPLRASVGVAISTYGEVDAEALLMRADAAMYAAKREAQRRSGAIL